MFRLRKKTMNLCVSDSEEREHGVGAGVNGTKAQTNLLETLQTFLGLTYSCLLSY